MSGYISISPLKSKQGVRGSITFDLMARFEVGVGKLPVVGSGPTTYLRDVLTRLPTMTNRQIKDIVPKAWAAASRNTTPRAA